MDISTNACKQKDCKVSETGICLESLELKDCPHFYLADSSNDRIEGVNESIGLNFGEKITLFAGQPFDIKTLSSITHKIECKFIFILGDYDAGKTTLLTTLFELFQKGPLCGDLFFAGSMTQVGFEERCFLSRMESGAWKSETERTKRSEFKFLHLAIKDGNKRSDNISNLVMSDISGEKVDLSRNSKEFMGELAILKYAHRIVFMIDGETLISKKKQSSSIYDSKMFIQMALDAGIFGKDTSLRVVISKWDLLKDNKDFDLNDLLVKPLSKQFKHLLGVLEFSTIAARPTIAGGEISMGFGLYDVVKDWINNESLPHIKNDSLIDRTNSTRMFNNFFYQSIRYEK
jgi:Double-GTPase 2